MRIAFTIQLDRRESWSVEASASAHTPDAPLYNVSAMPEPSLPPAWLKRVDGEADAGTNKPSTQGFGESEGR